VHAWSVLGPSGGAAQRGEPDFRAVQEAGFHTLVELARALTETGEGTPVRVDVVTDGLQDVLGEDVRVPSRATACGAATVLTQEFPSLRFRCIDVTLDSATPPARLVEQLVAELLAAPGDDVVAYRGTSRWRRAFAPVALDAAAPADVWRAGGGYLVTGACGDAGLSFAAELAAAGARLVLVGDVADGSGDGAADEAAEPRADRRAALEAAYPDAVSRLDADLGDPDEVSRVVAAARDRLDAAVKAKRLTRAEADRLAADLRAHVDEEIQEAGSGPHHRVP
jgi:hypothetical protein